MTQTSLSVDMCSLMLAQCGPKPTLGTVPQISSEHEAVSQGHTHIFLHPFPYFHTLFLHIFICLMGVG